MWGFIAGFGFLLGAAALTSKGAPAQQPPADRGFRFTDACDGLEVLDEAKAMAWARAQAAALPPGNWQIAWAQSAAGTCWSKMMGLTSIQQFLPHLAFFWRLTLAGLAGAVDSGKLTRAQAEAQVQQVLAQAGNWGIDPALLTPTTIPA